MPHKNWFLGLVLAGASSGGFPGVADAQQLSSGDLEQCKVFDEEDEFAGFDSVCLAEKRAALRDLESRNDHHRRHWGGYGRGGYDHEFEYDPTYQSVMQYACPFWANNGQGYPSTLNLDGPSPLSLSGFYDAPVNGVACLPNPVNLLEGF